MLFTDNTTMEIKAGMLWGVNGMRNESDGYWPKKSIERESDE